MKGVPTFVTIGRDAAASTGCDSRLQGTVSASGDVDLAGSAALVGEDAAAYRQFLADQPERRDELVTSLVQGRHPGATVSEPAIETGTRLDQPVRISYRLAKPASAAFAGEFMLLNIPWTLGTVPHSCVALEQRQHPLVLDEYRGRYAERIELRLPAGRVPASELKPAALSCPQGRFRIDWRWSGDGTIVAEKLLEIDALRVDPPDYPAFRKFLMDARRAEQEQVVLKGAE